jgi:ferrochelatase
MVHGVTAESARGVVLVAHGTVRELAELPAFLLRIRHGRPPSEELLSDMRRRYERIGGSPLLEITRAQADALRASLGLPVWVGMRLWDPPVQAALRAALDSGVERICIAALAPFSAHVYFAAARDCLEALGPARPSLVDAGPWGTEPALVRAHARAIRAAVGDDAGTRVVMTAHSLPTAVIRSGDPYAVQVEAASRAIEKELGTPARLAYQSQGADGGDWLGPNLSQTLRQVKNEGAARVAVAPIGFLAEHVETLYDLDIEARREAEALGLGWVRVPALNTDPLLIEALAHAVQRAFDAQRGGAGSSP